MEKKIQQLQTIVLATANQAKTREIKKLLKNSNLNIKDLCDFGPIPKIIEDGKTFEDNAYKKASLTSRILGYPAMADDSGLCVEALNGAPGIFSARYAGKNASDLENTNKLLENLKGKKNKNAFFKCVICISVPSGAALTYEGECHGIIIKKPAGNNGFGYDPVFFFPEFNKTFAQASMEEKNRVSHRGRALKKIANEINKIIQWIDINTPKFKSCEKNKS